MGYRTLLTVGLFLYSLHAVYAGQPDPSREQSAPEIAHLKQQAQLHRDALADLNRRIARLSTEGIEGAINALPLALRQKAKDVQREVARLQQGGTADDAAALKDQLADVLAAWAQPQLAVDSTQPTVHVVGVYEGVLPDGQQRQRRQHSQGTAKVRVDFPGQPITLVLCAYEPVKWQVTVAESSVVERVILSGYHSQHVDGLAATVAVEDFSGKRSTNRFYAYSRNDESYVKTARRVRELTGQSLQTFQGSYRFEDEAFVIGPANRKWLAQLVAARLEPLHARAMRNRRAQQRALRRVIEFHALYFPPIDDARSRRRQSPTSFGKFTPLGPDVGSLRSIPPRLSHVVTASPANKRYAIRGHDVVQLVHDNSDTMPLVIPETLPKLSWPCGLAYDSQRRRLILASLGGEGFLYAYDIGKEEWSVVASMRNLDLSALAYSKETDQLYGLAATHDRSSCHLITMTAAGTIVRQTTLAVPRIARAGPRAELQLATAGDYVVVLTQPQADPNDPAGKPVARCTVFDPKAGAKVYSGIMRPQRDVDAASPADYDTLWNALLTDDNAQAEQTMWRMVAGSDRAVAFLRNRFPPLPQPDAARVKALIRQLDADSFDEREAAYEKLANVAGQITETLEQTAKDHYSLEVRSRAERLVKAAESGTSDSPIVRRELRAVRVLARIGNSAAVTVLEKLARERPKGTRSQLAAELLKRL